MEPTLAAALEFVVSRTGHEPYRDYLRSYPEKAAPILLSLAAEIREAEGQPVLDGPNVLNEWTFVTTERLVRDTLTLAARLPPDIDLVCAVARSGLLPGALIATHYHLPLRTVSGGRGVTDPGHGGRLNELATNLQRTCDEPATHVLLIDDTAAMGREMRACLPLVRAAWPGAKVTRAVVYCHPRAVGDVDAFAFLYPGEHYLGWNVMNAGHGLGLMSDHDGILCRDFTAEECQDDATYRRVMATIEPLYLPRRGPLPVIVTARPESTRDITEDWLRRHGVRWDRLVMRDWEIDPGRGWNEQIATWKAGHYAASCLELFAESEPGQATIIAEATGKAVLCPAMERVIPPDPARRRTQPRRNDPYGTKPRVLLGTKTRH